MIDTNTLVAATLTLISQFHNVVSVPRIPHDRSEIGQLVIGSPFTPIEVFVRFHNGTSYHVRDGAVYRYETSNSFMNLQEPSQLSGLMGVEKVSSNDVLALATKVVEGLQKSGSPLASSPPKLSAAGDWNGKPIPYYGVTWPATNTAYGHSALVEVDARSGGITFLHLTDRCFKDYPLAQQISNRVYKPEPEVPHKRPTKKERVLPLPPKDEVLRTVRAWVEVCEKLKMYPGNQTNLVDVDWDRSNVHTNAKLSDARPICQVCFKNGAMVCSVGGAVLDCALSDKYYGSKVNERPDQRWKFVGKVAKRWEDLAKTFESTLVREFGFTTEVLSHFTTLTYVGDSLAPLGTETLTRVVVIWIPLITPTEAKTFRSPEVPPISVEFDTRSGEIKGFSFFGPPLAEIFARAQCAH